METTFQLTNALVLPFWLLMVLAPRWWGTRRLMESGLPIAALAGSYAWLVLPRVLQLGSELSRPTLPRVAALLGTPEGATLAWIHFLAFDLFVGRWIYLDSRKQGLSPWLTGPLLLLTLLFGPLGYLTYVAVRALRLPGPPTHELQANVRPMGCGVNAPSPIPTSSTFSFPLSTAVRRLWATSPALMLTGLASLVLLVPAAFAVFLDPRVITGAPAWLKPAKFLASTAIYSLTLAAFLMQIQGRERWVKGVANGTALALGVEMAIIGLQAARGTTSHFNTSTLFDGILWGLMGGFILLLWVLGFVAAGMLARQRTTDPVLALSLRLAMAVALLGMGEGILMAQAGAHSVSVRDGGPGLPIVGWSTTGGDLRIAHFFGLHALQAIPLVGWLLSRGAARHNVPARLRLVRLAAGSYAVLLLLLTWQALRGQSLIHPDPLTLGAFSALAFGTLIGVVLILIRRATAPQAILRQRRTG